MTILFAQVPRFYAEVERASDPGLGGRPIVVGGDPRKNGLVQAATGDALAAGVEVGMPMHDALLRCAGAHPARTDMRRYRESSARLRASFRARVERVEPVGLDAAYLEAERDPEELARDLMAGVAEELGLPLRIGIAPVKFVARLACEEAGEAGFRVVAPGEVAAFLGPLPLERLPGVGPRTQKALADLGARRVADLARLERTEIEERLGNHGLSIWLAARGSGDDRVRPASHPRSLSQELTLDTPELDTASLVERVAELCTRLEERLGREHLAGRRVALKVRYADGETATRSRTLPRAIALAGEIGPVARELLERTHAGERPIRGLAVAVSQLARIRRDDRQLDLFGGG